jgi:hypothetical protein
MNLKLDMIDIVPPALQWTIFDKDPIPGFKDSIKRLKDYYKKQLEKMENESQKQIERSSQIEANWCECFKNVTGDEVYLLTSMSDFSCKFAANTPDGKKWIVSKVVMVKGKPVCWCLPVDVNTGEEIEVKLTEDNAFALEATFNTVIFESGQH